VATTRARERLLIFGHARAGEWDSVKARFAAQSGPPPLASRLSAGNALEWIMMGAAAGGMQAEAGAAAGLLRVTTHDADRLPQPLAPEVGRTQAAPPVTWGRDDDAWVARSQALIEARVDTTLANLPAVISVSALKDLARPATQEDTAHAMQAPAVRLRSPSFAAATGEAEGRDIGVACHRFLQRADLTRLRTEATVCQQVETLVAEGRLSAEEGALVPPEDVAWFANTWVGKLAAAHAAAVRREVPFVYALPGSHDDARTIVRGVIDCVLETDAGLTIWDYKTDRVADEAALRERVAAYSTQLQLYAQAAERIFARPIAQAVLVFLRARQVVEVAAEAPSVEQLLTDTHQSPSHP
jgi:ATP-dependent exoDNAse (exonuclease V) beta subunit